MKLREADISEVLGCEYDCSYHELDRHKLSSNGDEPIKLSVKHNAVKGVLIVQWEYAGHTQWSFNKDCFDKTAEDIVDELVEQLKDVRSYNDLCIRILQYTTPI